MALNDTEYLAVRICENSYSYMTLIKGYSRNNVYYTRRDLIGNSNLKSVWKNCGVSKLNPQQLVGIFPTRFGM